MIIAILYLIAVAYVFFGSNGTYQPNMTHILMAAGIIGICGGLDEIKKEIGRDKHV
jgi:hypothetical protein